MEVAFFILLFIAFLIFLPSPKPVTMQKHKCFQDNQWHHTWVWRKLGLEGEYMVCEKCGKRPGIEHDDL